MALRGAVRRYACCPLRLCSLSRARLARSHDRRLHDLSRHRDDGRAIGRRGKLAAASQRRRPIDHARLFLGAGIGSRLPAGADRADVARHLYVSRSSPSMPRRPLWRLRSWRAIARGGLGCASHPHPKASGVDLLLSASPPCSSLIPRQWRSPRAACPTSAVSCWLSARSSSPNASPACSRCAQGHDARVKPMIAARRSSRSR